MEENTSMITISATKIHLLNILKFKTMKTKMETIIPFQQFNSNLQNYWCSKMQSFLKHVNKKPEDLVFSEWYDSAWDFIHRRKLKRQFREFLIYMAPNRFQTDHIAKAKNILDLVEIGRAMAKGAAGIEEDCVIIENFCNWLVDEYELDYKIYCLTGDDRMDEGIRKRFTEIWVFKN